MRNIKLYKSYKSQFIAYVKSDFGFLNRCVLEEALLLLNNLEIIYD